MAKQAQQSKAARSKNGDVVLEQNLAIDDSLLPSAEELSKLKDVDPTIIKWIMDRTEIEQNARHRFNDSRVELAKYDLKKTHGFNRTSLVFGFLITLVILLLSAFFVIQGYPVQGTLFGGTAILACAIFFIRASRTKSK